MKKITWNDVIQSDVENINLIGYGSILNHTTHEWDSSHLETVIVHGFKRTYNLKMVPDGMDRTIIEAFMKKYWVKYGITTLEQVEELGKEQVCVLNAICTDNDSDTLNGVLINIPRKDFEIYQKREEIYDLYKTHYSIIHTDTGEITPSDKWWYILSAHEEYLIENGHAFLPYHSLAREWAYHYGKLFGEMFDATTFRVQKELPQ